jgi:perosamine synthetase
MVCIPVNEPVITPAAKRYVADAMETGWVSSAGPYIDRFEAAFAAYIGRKHAVTTMNGTAALHLALVGLGVSPGDEVIIPSFTMVACVDAVLYCGAVPVFCDIDPQTFTVDPQDVERKITKKTKVIMPVHIYGHPADMDPILVLGKQHDIAVLEDAAEAHGAEYRGRLCGAMGDAAAFSFYGNKIITTGEGGMVVTDDDALAGRLRKLKDLAHSPKQRFWHEEIGFNYRMTNLQAALGLGQLESIDHFLERKQSMAQRYTEGLKGIAGLQTPVTKQRCTNVFWMYAITLAQSFPLSRDALRAALKKRDIDTRDFFYPLHQMPLVSRFVSKGTKLPVTEDIALRGCYLPSGLAITDEQIDTVVDAVRDVARSA